MKSTLPARMGHTVRYGRKDDHDDNDAQALSADAVANLVTQAVDKAFAKAEQRTRPPRAIFSKQVEGRSTIESPTSWRKGNLPLHGKQLLNVMLKRPVNDGIDTKDVERGEALGDGMIDHLRSAARAGVKALTSTGVGTGDELVPTDLSSELQRRMYLASNLAAVMASREIDMPSQPYDFPLATTRPTFYLEAVENTATDASDPGTGKITLDAKKFMAQVEFSYELDEDAILPVLPWLQQLLAEAAADAWEHALINGDTTATHMDTDEEELTKSPAFAFKGFRKLALAGGLKADLSTGGVTSNDNMRAVRKLLKKYGGNPRNLIWLASPTSAITMQGIAEAVSVDKFGSRATIVTGEIAALQGIPIIQSERVREDVDATGVNGAADNTKSTVMCVNVSQFLTGRRRDFTVEIDRDITKQQHIVVASFRRAFVPVETPSATITSLGLGYNFAP